MFIIRSKFTPHEDQGHALLEIREPDAVDFDPHPFAATTTAIRFQLDNG